MSLKVEPPLRMSFSGSNLYGTCPKAYWFRYVLKARVTKTSVNLAYGRAIGESIEDYFRDAARGESDADSLVDAFKGRMVAAEDASGGLEYPSRGRTDLATFLQIGETALRQFPVTIDEEGLVPLGDPDGNLLLEVDLAAHLSDDVIFRGKPDALMVDRQGRVLVIDWKTSSSPAPDWFPQMSHQLTGYNILVEANAERLGIPSVDRLGVVDLIKNKAKPRIVTNITGQRRTDEEVGEFIDQTLFRAEAIRKGHFPTNPQMAWNTPCSMCDFRKACIEGDWSDITVPQQSKVA